MRHNIKIKLQNYFYQNKSVLSPGKIKKVKLDKNTIQYYYNFNLDPDSNISIVLVIQLSKKMGFMTFYHKNDINLKKPLHLYPDEWSYYTWLKTPDGRLKLIDDAVSGLPKDRELVDNYISKENKKIISKKIEEISNRVIKKEKPDVVYRNLDLNKINMKRYQRVKDMFEKNGYYTIEQIVEISKNKEVYVNWDHIKNKYKNYVSWNIDENKDIKVNIPKYVATSITPKKLKKHKNIIKKLFGK